MDFQPGQPAFGGGAGGTTFHPIMMVAVSVAIVLILILPRKHVVIPLLLVAFLGSRGQQLYIGGIHLFAIRILILTGLARVVSFKQTEERHRFAGGWNGVDSAFTAWTIFHALANILQYGGASGAFVYQTGLLWEILGGYIVLRFLIQDQEDIVRTIKVFACVAVVLGLSMMNEKFRSQNIFGYLGSVPIVPLIREGSIRAQGASAHAILAGVFGATLVPLFWWLWQSGKAKLAGVAGFFGATAMLLTCASSTPLLSYISAVVALCFWPLRKSMRTVRWVILLSLAGLHLVMKAPVWFLIARVDIVSGNSGYHRAELIDQCVRHFNEWWLYGTTAAPTWGWDMWDLCNQFVTEADTGGLLTFICFLLVVTRTFSRIGSARKIIEGDRDQEWFMYLLGVTLFTHVMSFFGISYFDQTMLSWSAFLAIVAAATSPILATSRIKVSAPVSLAASQQLALRGSGLVRTQEDPCDNKNVVSRPWFKTPRKIRNA
jgi:hypothetical protein